MKNEKGSKIDEIMRDNGFGARSKRALHEFSDDLSGPLKRMK